MKTYEVTQCTGKPDWAKIPTAAIDTYLWSDVRSILPSAQAAWDTDALYVRLQAIEPNIRREYTGDLDPVCQDSCLEFFFSPDPTDNRYFNIEFNPNGCMYLGTGRNVQTLLRLLPEDKPIDPVVTYTETGWAVEYAVPCSFIRRIFPDFSPVSGGMIRANCYKCGDETVQPHYFSWNPIELTSPSFHCPEFFGIMYFD